MSIQRLQEILRPPENPIESGHGRDWAAVESRLGTRLPSDYEQFIEVFGTGCIDNFVWIYNGPQLRRSRFHSFMRAILLQILPLLLMQQTTADAKLIVQVGATNRVGDKVTVKLTLKNTFAERIESARATLFLINDQEKIVGQKSEWIIGGTKDRPALAPDASTTYNFVISSAKPFTKTKLIFNRIILDGGKQVDPKTAVEILEGGQRTDR